jgi:hypothetical protein
VKRNWSIIGLTAVAASVVLWFATPTDSAFNQATTWQSLASPGRLSAAHAHLANDCAACHTPVTGVESVNCIVCHANDESILQRQPTSFHANITSCKECHKEHQGPDQRPMSMDHAALARIGRRQLNSEDADSEQKSFQEQLAVWSDIGALPHSHISSDEAILDCATCHSNDDRHFTLFGQDCAQCHATDRWTIPEFRHPSPSSMDCAQCHRAPPSHYMMHFKMVSARVAGQPHAEVSQCFQCHQTTAWNDIRNVGWYKHH